MKRNQKNLSIGFLYDDTLDSSNGVSQYVKTLGSWLSSRGHSVSYLVGETELKQWSGGKVYSLAKNLKVIFNGNHMSMPLLAKKEPIKKVIKENNFDVVHVQVPYSPLMAKRVIDSLGTSTSIVGTFHIYPASRSSEIGSHLLRRLLGASLKKFDLMISVSQPAANFARKAYKIDSEVIPNMVDLSRFSESPKKQLPGNNNHIVFLGKLVNRKGCMYLLKAFVKLKQAVPDARLTIAGDGPERSKLENYVKQNKIDDSVDFLGHIDEAKKPSILSGAAIACFPSLYGESFGIVLLEAMAAGAGVVVAGNNPGYDSVLQNNPEVLFDPRDTENFANKLQFVLSEKQKDRELHQIQQSIVKKYDVDTVGPQVVAAYRRAIAKRNQSGHN